MEEIYLYKPDVQVCRYVFYIDQICKQCVHIREKSVLLEADGRSHSNKQKLFSSRHHHVFV